jgi:hypothetical protein
MTAATESTSSTASSSSSNAGRPSNPAHRWPTTRGRGSARHRLTAAHRQSFAAPQAPFMARVITAVYHPDSPTPKSPKPPPLTPPTNDVAWPRCRVMPPAPPPRSITIACHHRPGRALPIAPCTFCWKKILKSAPDSRSSKV